MFKLAAALCVRNEALYLREWVEFHRLVGFDRFYFYVNESTDLTWSICNEYENMGLATLHNWPGKRVQRAAFIHALQQAQEDEVKWCAFIDCDEFLFSPTYRSVPEILVDYEAYPGVGVHWMLFGSSGHGFYLPKPIIERFIRRQDEVNPHIKSIVRPEYVVAPGSDAHWFHYRADINDGMAVDENRNPIAPYTPLPGGGTANILRVHHYSTKSKEESEIRVKQGRVDVKDPNPWPEHFLAHDRNDVEDTAATFYLEPLLRNLNV